MTTSVITWQTLSLFLLLVHLWLSG